MDVKSPLLWDNEHPNLYRLHLDLYEGENSIAQIEKKFGFREVEVRGNRLLVNGRPVKLRGVCRHEAHPLYGRSLTDEEWKADAELYRAANCNFIRTSHLPEPSFSHFLVDGQRILLEQRICTGCRIHEESRYNPSVCFP